MAGTGCIIPAFENGFNSFPVDILPGIRYPLFFGPGGRRVVRLGQTEIREDGIAREKRKLENTIFLVIKYEFYRIRFLHYPWDG
jgi:hypothetical protein